MPPVGAMKVIEKACSRATSWVSNLVALLADVMAAKMVEELLDCLMVPGIKLVISTEHVSAFWMVA
jgi:hypothetical protein